MGNILFYYCRRLRELQDQAELREEEIQLHQQQLRHSQGLVQQANTRLTRLQQDQAATDTANLIILNDVQRELTESQETNRQARDQATRDAADLITLNTLQLELTESQKTNRQAQDDLEEEIRRLCLQLHTLRETSTARNLNFFNTTQRVANQEIELERRLLNIGNLRERAIIARRLQQGTPNVQPRVRRGSDTTDDRRPLRTQSSSPSPFIPATPATEQAIARRIRSHSPVQRYTQRHTQLRNDTDEEDGHYQGLYHNRDEMSIPASPQRAQQRNQEEKEEE